MRTALSCLLMMFVAIGPARAAEPFAPKSMAYVLQSEGLGKPAAAVATLAACDRDLIVIDPFHAGDPPVRWTAAEIETIRAGKPGRRVVAYLSIGEAEDYRGYWKKEWASARPEWLLDANPKWPGNFKVRYWDPGWQKIILAEVDAITAAGFDGVYLDIVDAFENFEYDAAKKDWIDDRPNPGTGQTYRLDMIAWVKMVAVRARAARPGALVIPQNGSQLLHDDGFRAVISAIGVEDLFTDGRRKQPSEHTDPIFASLALAARDKKPVLVIDYSRKEALTSVAIDGAKAHGYTLLITGRALKTLGSCPPISR